MPRPDEGLLPGSEAGAAGSRSLSCPRSGPQRSRARPRRAGWRACPPALARRNGAEPGEGREGAVVDVRRSSVASAASSRRTRTWYTLERDERTRRSKADTRCGKCRRAYAGNGFGGFRDHRCTVGGRRGDDPLPWSRLSTTMRAFESVGSAAIPQRQSGAPASSTGVDNPCRGRRSQVRRPARGHTRVWPSDRPTGAAPAAQEVFDHRFVLVHEVVTVFSQPKSQTGYGICSL